MDLLLWHIIQTCSVADVFASRGLSKQHALLLPLFHAPLMCIFMSMSHGNLSVYISKIKEMNSKGIVGTELLMLPVS